MPPPSEPQILADVLHNTRQLTLFYLQHCQDLDKSRRFTLGEFQTNSIHWIVCHLTWTEDFLILRGGGDPGKNFPWLERFSLGAAAPEPTLYPSYEEALQAFQEVHQASLELLNALPSAVLEEPNHVGLEFSLGKNKRAVIYHCIRHEGAHAGHLGWLLRLHGKKVI